MATPCRLIIDSPRDGPWNMAMDEVLLDSAAERGVATLRFYRWSEPTLSLGYFQRSADRVRHEASRACPVVRRSSGGGAILHDREVTYSMALPASHPLSESPVRLYRATHEALAAVLKVTLGQHSGVELQIRLSLASSAAEPFLCFERRARGDVLLSGANAPTGLKIAGSAQRRRRGAVLQHGSVLLSTSRCAPELRGIAEVAGVAMEPDGLIAAWTPRIGTALDLGMKPQPLPLAETALAEKLAAEKFASSAWTNRR